MIFRNQLKKLNACPESLEYLIDPVCDMVEEVLHLVPEDGQLSCIWAISAVKRHANSDELAAAFDAATAAYAYYFRTRTAAARAASEAAASVAYAFAANISYYYAEAANIATYAAYYYASDADPVANTYAHVTLEEQKKQCDIIRKYFTIDQVREAFNKLVD